jgi:hypothetical protein
MLCCSGLQICGDRRCSGARDGAVGEHARRAEGRHGGRGGELGVAGVEGVEAAEGDAQVVAEDDTARGQHRRATAGVAGDGAEERVAGVEHCWEGGARASGCVECEIKRR